MGKGTRTRSAVPVGVAIACAVVSGFFLLTASAHADYEAVSFGVNEFDTTGCGVVGDDRTYNDEYINSFFHYAWGATHWDYDYVRPTSAFSYNADVHAADFTDPTRYSSWGADNVTYTGSDFADAIFLATHGHSKCMELSELYDESTGDWNCCGYEARCAGETSCATYNRATFVMGNDDNTCNVSTNNWSGNNGHILFGNTDANVFLTTACNSITPCTRHHSGYTNMTTGDFDTYMGFYGRHDDHDGAGLAALDAYFSGVEFDHMGSDWLADNHFPNASNPNGYVCPMVLIWGSSNGNCDNQYNNGGFKDFKDTGAHSTSVMYWVGGCDPNSPGYDLLDYDRPALPDL